jgi:polysaccharide deacetylase family protein (PEP-CTERM system associated)
MQPEEPPNPLPTPFLFSVDLEDVRTMIPNGKRFAERVPANVGRYLEFLHRHDMRCTFFTVGDIARRYPELVREIAGAGHEMACHGSDHIPLPRLDPQRFQDDVARNIDALLDAGASDVRGFRAPVLSLTQGESWAWEGLSALGITYSSSVLPARSPLYGWRDFPRDPSRRASGVWEIPINVTGWPALDLPLACGTYLRITPYPLIRVFALRERAHGRALAMYCHPYDIDTEQERFMHPELDDSPLTNRLMYLGRHRLLRRLDKLTALLGTCVPYADYVAQLDAHRPLDEGAPA